jgi:hypothetical protein
LKCPLYYGVFGGGRAGRRLTTLLGGCRARAAGEGLAHHPHHVRHHPDGAATPRGAAVTCARGAQHASVD